MQACLSGLCLGCEIWFSIIGRSLQRLLMSKMIAVIMTTLAGLLVSGVAATIIARSKINVGFDKAYTENVLFESPVRSKLHCAVLCNQNDCCATFTFDQKNCRAHAMMVTSNTPSTPAPGARSYSRNIEHKPWNCADTQLYSSVSGVVTIYPEDDNTPLQVYCDHDTDGGGWLVFQRRQDGSVDFDRTWTEYQNGFGDLQGEFWLGLDALHALTSRQKYELRVDLMKFDGTKGNATHNNFIISNSSDKYRLSIDTSLNVFDDFGHLGNDLYDRHNRAQFSLWDPNKTIDYSYPSCYNGFFHGGWWSNNDGNGWVSLNGRYQSNRTRGWDGIWWDLFDFCYSLKFSEMKIRPMCVKLS